MSLNYNTELALINTTTNSGTITLPSATTVPGRVISFKDSAGNFLTNNFTLICDGSDTFEDGTTQKVFNESFGSIQVVASGTKWYILSGVKQNMMTISSLLTSSILSYNSLSVSSFTNSLSTSVIFTNSINAPVNINFGKSIIPFSGNNFDIGAGGAFRWNRLFVSTVSAITTFTSNIIGPGNSVVTQNLYPQSAGSQFGFFGGAGTNSGGFYGQINVRSTITQVILPDIVGAFSNNIRVQGNLSTQNIFSSTINSGTVTLTTGGFTQRVVSSAVAPSGTVTLNLTSGNVFFFTTATPTATTVNFTTLSATVGSTYYVNFLSGTPTAAAVTFTGNTGATTLSITGLSLVGNPSVSIGLHGAAQSFTPAVNTRYMFTCIAIAP